MKILSCVRNNIQIPPQPDAFGTRVLRPFSYAWLNAGAATPRLTFSSSTWQQETAQSQTSQRLGCPNENS